MYVIVALILIYVIGIIILFKIQYICICVCAYECIIQYIHIWCFSNFDFNFAFYLNFKTIYFYSVDFLKYFLLFVELHICTSMCVYVGMVLMELCDYMCIHICAAETYTLISSFHI